MTAAVLEVLLVQVPDDRGAARVVSGEAPEDLLGEARGLARGSCGGFGWGGRVGSRGLVTTPQDLVETGREATDDGAGALEGRDAVAGYAEALARVAATLGTRLLEGGGDEALVLHGDRGCGRARRGRRPVRSPLRWRGGWARRSRHPCSAGWRGGPVVRSLRGVLFLDIPTSRSRVYNVGVYTMYASC